MKNQLIIKDYLLTGHHFGKIREKIRHIQRTRRRGKLSYGFKHRRLKRSWVNHAKNANTPAFGRFCRYQCFFDKKMPMNVTSPAATNIVFCYDLSLLSEAGFGAVNPQVNPNKTMANARSTNTTVKKVGTADIFAIAIRAIAQIIITTPNSFLFIFYLLPFHHPSSVVS